MVEFRDRAFKPHPLHWVVEPLWAEPSYFEKSMFGCRGCYRHGRLILALASRDKEPWKGILIPTEKAYHESLLNEFPKLMVHPLLKKWLYLPEETEEFEEMASKLVHLIARHDLRIGVIPQPKKQKQKGPPIKRVAI
jgi:hypothetical protein